jgi:hypothetical protein
MKAPRIPVAEESVRAAAVCGHVHCKGNTRQHKTGACAAGSESAQSKQNWFVALPLQRKEESKSEALSSLVIGGRC